MHFLKKILLPVFPSHSTIWKMANTNFLCLLFYGNTYTYIILVTMFRLASPGFATWRRRPVGVFFAILATFCQFDDFDNFLAIFWPILILGQFVIAVTFFY